MTYIHLECGCQYNFMHVLLVCGKHADELRAGERAAEQRYREYVNQVSLACAEASAVVRRPAPTSNPQASTGESK